MGGEFREVPLPLLGPESIAAALRRGLETYQRHLGRRPTVFGRRQFGLSAALPQIVRRLGFTAAFHCTLDDGQFPVGSQSRIQWEGIDGSTIEAPRLRAVGRRPGRFVPAVAEMLAQQSTIDRRPRWCLPIGRAKRAVGTTICGGWRPTVPCWGKFLTLGGYFSQSRWDSPPCRL